MKHRIAALTVLAQLGLVASAAAQAAAQPPATPTQPPAPTGPVIQLTMAQAEQMALENNLQLKIDRLDPAIAAENLAQARAPFNPALSTSFSRQASQSPPQRAEQGTADIVRTLLTGSTRVDHSLPWLGSRYSVSWSATKNESSAIGESFNPSLSAGLNFNLTQPLLSGLRIDGNRAGVQTQIRNRNIADIRLDERIMLTRFQAQLAYMNLIAARNSREVALINLEIARRQLRDNQARVEVGTMAPIDIIEGEAEVARNEEAVIRAEASIAANEDSLRALVLDPARPDYWQVRFEPTDTPTLTPQDVDVDAAVQTALRQRTDLVIARQQMEIVDLNIRVTKDSVLPTANLQFNYSTTGAGGTVNTWQDGVIIATASRGSFRTVVSDTFKNNLPTWSLGLNVQYPIGKSGQEANLARSRIQRQQQETSLRALELGIVTDVRAVGRDVQTNYRRVLVTQKARERAQAQLDAEEKKFAVGMSSTFQLQQRQRDLAGARNAEVNATMDYNRSLIQFEAIQKAPVR